MRVESGGRRVEGVGDERWGGEGCLPCNPTQKVRMRSSISTSMDDRMLSFRWLHTREPIDGDCRGGTTLERWWSGISKPVPLVGVLGTDSFSSAIFG